MSPPSLSADKLHVDIKKSKEKKDSPTTTLSLTNKAYEEDFDDAIKTRIDGVAIQMNEDDIHLKI